MTHQKKNTPIGQILEALIENGLEGLEEAVSILLNEAMKVERKTGAWVLQALAKKPRTAGLRQRLQAALSQ